MVWATPLFQVEGQQIHANNIFQHVQLHSYICIAISKQAQLYLKMGTTHHVILYYYIQSI